MDLSYYLPQMQFRYYFEQLDAKEQAVYETLLDGYFKQKRSIRLSGIPVLSLQKIHGTICCDVPELFFVKWIRASASPFSGGITVYPEYRFHEEERAAVLTQMETATEHLLRRINRLSDREKVKEIHDFLVRTAVYRDAEAPYSHEAPGTILYGIGVCEGISKAFKYLADRADLCSVVAVGEVPGTGEGIGHAWNAVVLDGQPYHIDATFDCTLSRDGAIRYDYFLLSDAQIAADHRFQGLSRFGV